MKNISRKIQLGLVAIVTAATMLVPSSLAAAQNPTKPTIERPRIIVCFRNSDGSWDCYIIGKTAPAPVSVFND